MAQPNQTKTQQNIDRDAAATTLAAMFRHYNDLGDRLHLGNPSRIEREQLLHSRTMLREWLARYETEAGIESFRTEAA